MYIHYKTFLFSIASFATCVKDCVTPYVNQVMYHLVYFLCTVKFLRTQIHVYDKVIVAYEIQTL